MYDITYYNKTDEKKFIELALKLNYNGIVFLHTLKDFVEVKSKKLDVVNAIICLPKEVQKARRDTNFVFVQSVAGKDESDRLCMEKFKPDGMFGFEGAKRKDFMHHRNSSLNQILAKIMFDKKVAYVLDCSMLLDEKLRVKVLGRIKQNLILAKKYKVNIVLGSFAKSPYDMLYPNDAFSLLSFVGLNPKECKQAFINIKKITEHNAFIFFIEYVDI